MSTFENKSKSGKQMRNTFSKSKREHVKVFEIFFENVFVSHVVFFLKKNYVKEKKKKK